ncbi:IS21 family transposase [Ornithinibacillus salinisoli]|uniref:IS21 family transposase n=1 Tax=Ornithinibacillus salinisoli TaxID=1848459 RepID=A0ABW4W5Q8_9BACI
MDKWQVYMEIDQLLKQGFSKSKVAEKLGISRPTLYRYLNRNPQEMAEWMVTIQSREKKLDKYKELILSWLRQYPDMTAAQVQDWLLEKYPSFEVGESTVRSYVRELRKEYNIPKETSPRSYEAIPDPPLGEQVQVDFGQTKNKKANGAGTVKLYFIAFVLSHSRYKYMYWLDRPFTTKDVIESHELAFQWFHGIPNELVYDQDNLLVISENNGDLILTEEFQRYKEAKKLNLFVCRKADPESKGKIENVVGFIKHNYAKHRLFHNLESWNEYAIEWLNRTGNAKVHNTTKKRPVEVFALEKQHLKPVTNIIDVQHNNNNSISRSIRKDNTIRYLSNRYSLPLGSFHKYKEVYLTVVNDEKLIICSPDGEILAKHQISIEKGKLIQDRKHQRDRTKGIDAFINSVATYFDNQELAHEFISRLREKNPRYIRDQLQLILNSIKTNHSMIINSALDECIHRNLYSGTDFSDIIGYLKRQRPLHITENDNAEQLKRPTTMTSNWVMDTNASKREMDKYYSILEGDSQ